MKQSEVDLGIFMKYQPIWHVPTKKIIGYEATVSGKQGQNAAKLFREHASDRAAFDRQLIDLAMQEGTKMLEPDQLLFINLHPDTLSSGALPKENTEHVIFEITERTKLTETARARLKELKSNGYRLAMDDFGKQYSNLDRLLQYWSYFGFIKLDRCFVRALHQPHTEMMLETMVALSHKLDLIMIAEGVETHAQLEALARCGVDYMQGYYLGYPVPYEEGVS